MSRQLEKEEKIQKALGTLSHYRVVIYGPRGGCLGRFGEFSFTGDADAIEAIAPIYAIKYACAKLCYGMRKRFLRSHQLSFAGHMFKNKNCGCSVYISLDSDVHNVYNVNDLIVNDLRCILDVNGNIRKNIPKDLLEELRRVQNE